MWCEVGVAWARDVQTHLPAVHSPASWQSVAVMHVPPPTGRGVAEAAPLEESSSSASMAAIYCAIFPKTRTRASAVCLCVRFTKFIRELEGSSFSRPISIINFCSGHACHCDGFLTYER